MPVNSVLDVRAIGLPGAGTYEGQDGFLEFIEQWAEAFPGARVSFDLVHEIPGRDVLFTVTHQEIRGASSDVPIAFRFASIADRSPDRTFLRFGLDLSEMRDEFTALFGQDPGPIPAERESGLHA